MFNFVTNGHARPIVYAYELTPREIASAGMTPDEVRQESENGTAYVRYRGNVIPVNDFSASWGMSRESGLPSEFAGWHGYLSDSYFSGLVIRFPDESDTDFVVIGRFWACDCSEDYGPCATHSEEIAQRVGSSNRSADELCAVFVSDALDALQAADYTFSRALWEEIDAMRARLDNPASWEGSWLSADAYLDDTGRVLLADAMRDICDRDLTDALAEVGLSVSWDDGYRIYRLTGGPLA